jgi:hypothetical protein
MAIDIAAELDSVEPTDVEAHVAAVKRLADAGELDESTLEYVAMRIANGGGDPEAFADMLEERLELSATS